MKNPTNFELDLGMLDISHKHQITIKPNSKKNTVAAFKKTTIDSSNSLLEVPIRKDEIKDNKPYEVITDQRLEQIFKTFQLRKQTNNVNKFVMIG